MIALALKNPAWIACAALALLLAVSSGALYIAKADLEVCSSKLQTANDKVEMQNAQVEIWRATAINEEARVRQAATQARTSRTKADKAADAIMAEVVPDDCSKAASWAREKLKVSPW